MKVNTKGFLFHYLSGCFLILILLVGYSSSHAQTINRVSVADRADGLGQVIRFHMSATPDSFKINQSSPELIQAIFYGNSLSIRNEPESFRSPIQRMEFHEIPGGLGIDLRLHQNASYLGRIYHDQNRRDVLIGLTRVSFNEITSFTKGFTPLDWDDFKPKETHDVIVDEVEIEDNENPSDDFFFTPVPRSTIKFDTIVIDPGHGGRDPGAIGFRGTHEKNIALAVALKVGEYIKQHMPEMNVVFTRDTDKFVSLSERGRIANRNQGDLFISIHTNGHPQRQPHGAEFFFLGMNRSQAALEVSKRENAVIQFEDVTEGTALTEDQLLIYELSNAGYMSSSRRFAELLDQQFSQRAQRRSRGVKQAGLQVLWEASMPGVLIELGFISNPEEERFMTSEYGQAILASAIFRSIREYKEIIERSNTNRNSSR